MKIYLSDPCSGYNEQERDDFFEGWEEYFRRFGFDVFNPRKNGLPRSSSWAEHMRVDIAQLCSCDVLVRLSDYSSKGVKLELHVAKQLGIKIVDYDQVERCIGDIDKLKYLFS